MAKYLIDIPDEEENMWEGFNGDLFIPITMNKGTKTWVNTDLKMTPYTEPDRKAVDLQYARDIENVARMNYNEGAKDAWDFTRAVNDMGYDDFVSCFDGKTEEMVYELSYSEVKAKYDAWKKQKEEICVGDEVIYNSRTRAVVVMPETEERYGTILTSEFDTIYVSHDDLEKTGRRFEKIVELLKKMKEQ